MTESAHAHDLEIDQFNYFPAESGQTLRSQLIFDPELTRAVDEELPQNEAKERVHSFVRQQLTLRIDGQPCDPEIKVRELYRKGGATAGDSVLLLCPLDASATTHTLIVELGPDLRQLHVSGPRLGPDGQREHTTLVHPQNSTPPLTFRRAGPAGPAAPATSGPELSQTRPSSSPLPFFEVALSYMKTGFLHILPLGADHVLFVIGIVLPAVALRPVLVQLTGFTLAHTLTLALVSLGVVTPQALWVEACIALSIALLGVENLFLRRDRLRARLILVVFFGLIHGMGFAGALKELAPSLDSFTSALVGFNLGVEAGQVVVAGALGVLLFALGKRPAAREHVVQAGSWALVLIGLYWTVSRLI